MYAPGTRTCVLLGAFAVASLLSGCGLVTTPQQVLARADKNLAAHHYRAAVVDLENLVAKQPNDPALRLKLAQALLHTGRYVESDASFRRAQQLGTPWTAVTVDLAEALLAEGQARQAIDLLTAHPPTGGPEGALLSLRGRAFLALRRFDDARTSLTQAIALDPANIPARIALAALDEAQNDFAGAKIILDAGAATAPADFSIHLALGAWYMNQRQVREAHAEFARALDSAVAGIRAGSEPDRDEYRALASLMETDLLLGDPASAAQRLVRLRKLAPHAPSTLLLEARIDLAQKRPDDARTVLEGLLNRDPQNEPAKVLLGAASAASGALAQADMYLSSALAANPGDLGARKLLAHVELEERKPQDALKTATEPDAAMDADLLTLAGRASALTGDLSGATQYLERSQQAAPQDKLRALDLAAAYLAGNRPADAVRLLQGLTVPASLADQRELLLLVALSKSGSPASVRSEAERFVAERPRDPEALLLEARVLASAKDFDGARQLINQAAGLDPRSARPWVALGALEWSQRSRAAADAAFRHALQVDSRSVGAELGEAELALAAGDRDGAIHHLEQARTLSARSVPARLTLARLYLSAGEPRQAAAPLGEAAKIAPDDPNVRVLLGELAFARGDGAAAVTIFERLSADYPKSALLQADLARAYVLAQRPADARSASTEAVRLAPDYWPALALSMSLALDAGDQASATQLLERMRAAKAPAPAVESAAGDLAAHGGKLAEALTDYTAAAAVAPTAALALKIAALRHATHAADPDASLQAWLKRTPGDIRVRLALAQYLQSGGDRAAAAQEYETVLAAVPDQVVALNNLAWLKLEAGQNEKALSLARQAYAAAPNQAAVEDTFGWALVQTGNAQDALPLLRSAYGAAPDKTDIHLHFAVALMKTGDSAAARHELQAIVSAKPHGAEAEQARSLLTGMTRTS